MESGIGLIRFIREVWHPRHRLLEPVPSMELILSITKDVVPGKVYQANRLSSSCSPEGEEVGELSGLIHDSSTTSENVAHAG